MKNNEYVRLGGVLLAITAVVAMLLGYFNSITFDVIAANKEQKKTASMMAVLPAATRFEAYDGKLYDDGPISEVYRGYNDIGDFVGCCFELTPKGYGGEMTVMAGVDPDGAVAGVDIVEHSETAGLGANADDPIWLTQFTGKTHGLTVVKNAQKDDQIQAVTSATITSRAITGAVDSALEFFSAEIMEKEGK